MSCKFFIAYFLLYTYNVESKPSLEDYCEYDRRNTPCQYQCALSHERCKQLSREFLPLTNNERSYVLQKHNELRNEVALGNHSNNFLPPATNMHVLSYDKECEFLAACYVRQCIWAHDVSRRTLEGEILGQNLYAHSSEVLRRINTTFYNNAIMAWFNEKNLLTQNFSDLFLNSYATIDDPNIVIGHLTQLVWGNVKFVGCAKLESKRKNNLYTQDLFCDYKPTGNVLGTPMYIKGPSATNCADGVNVKYKGLCGNIRPFNQDKYISPIPELIGINSSTRLTNKYLYYSFVMYFLHPFILPLILSIYK